MKEITKQIKLQQFEAAEEVDIQGQKLLEVALEATARAYAPYSDFHVGAAILLENGQMILGCNQENAAFPSGLCAERVAFFSAGAQFPGLAITSLAITIRSASKADHAPAAPCGACLQVMRDVEMRQEKPIRVLLKGSGAAVYVAESIDQFLPFGFSLIDK